MSFLKWLGSCSRTTNGGLLLTMTTTTNGSNMALESLIHSIDSAFSEMNARAVHSAMDAQEARQNARAAADLVKQLNGAGKTITASIEASINTSSPSKVTTGVTECDPAQPKLKITPMRPSDRLARSQAEDLLDLSLQLEKAQQSLDAQAKAHDEALIRVKQECYEQLQQERESLQHSNESLRDQLNHLQGELQAAEEDAQVALSLAQANHESRVQVEASLEEALQEIHHLRSSKNGNAKKVRFAPPSAAAPPRPKLVSVGRQLLQRQSPSNNRRSPRDRRNELVDRLQEAQRKSPKAFTFASIDSVADSASSSVKSNPPKIREEDPATRILQESGRRLQLGGKYFKDDSMTSDPVEVVAKHYTDAVEVEIQRRQGQVTELESLCGVWEEKMNMV